MLLSISRAVLLCAAVSIAPAQTVQQLAGFNFTDGEYPDYESLVQGLDGNFYGTTLKGGANNAGTVFKITPTGVLTTLHDFSGSDGGEPSAGLVLASDGNFYGTTGAGGANGHGTIFKITPTGSLTTLHSFNGTDGAGHIGPLIQSTGGGLWGTAYQGGNSSNCRGGCGTIFNISTSGDFTSIYSFSGSDGSAPYAGVVQAWDGDYYGTTLGGGPDGRGTIFKITSLGVLTTLYTFPCTGVSCPDGFGPSGSLVQAADGNLYGTAAQGGAANYGTVFKITPAGSFTLLASFNGSNGMYPYAGLIESGGNLYGTTAGRTYGYGTIFEITPAGTLASLSTINGSPHGGLLQSTNGRFYGTTYNGGSDRFGMVYWLDAGLGPFVTTLPASGAAGATVRILGTGLTGATGVTFNGVPALFTVQASSEITAAVPHGASTGSVEVTLPSGVLVSNTIFRVR